MSRDRQASNNILHNLLVQKLSVRLLNTDQNLFMNCEATHSIEACCLSTNQMQKTGLVLQSKVDATTTKKSCP